MKLTKRLICLMLAVMLAFALCACGEKKIENKIENNIIVPSDTQTQTQTQPLPTVDPWEGNLDGENQFNDATLAW